MGTPSDALAEYLGRRRPSELLADLEREEQAKRDAARVMTRRAALEKARAARSEAAARRAQRLIHVHPHDDEGKLYLIAGKGKQSTDFFFRRICDGRWTRQAFVVAARAVGTSSLMKAPTPANACPVCLGIWVCWKLFGTNKPLTLRRLNAFKSEEQTMAELIEAVAKNTVQSDTAKTGRETALEKALVVLLGSSKTVDGKIVRTPPPESVMRMEPGARQAAADFIIGLIQAEGDRRRGKPERVVTVHDGEEHVRDAALVRRAWHVELARMNLPKEVLAALRGA